MPPPDSEFIGHLKTLEWTRTKIERLSKQGALLPRDVERVYEGLYLEAITSLESYIEELFVRLLTGRGPSSGIVARVTFNSVKVARDVILGGERYLDWLPYEKTEKRAEAFFRRGEPFTRLENDDKKMINDDLLIIRNVIAHKSHHARDRFKKFAGNYPLPPKEQTPASFLRSKIDPDTTRQQFYIAEMARIMKQLCQ